MKYVFITKDNQHIKLKIHRKSQDCVEFVEDLGVVQIASSQWSIDVMNEISATLGDPRRIMDTLREQYKGLYPEGFECMPLTRSDLKVLLEFFTQVQEETMLDGDEDNYWTRAKPYDEQSVLHDLETTLEN